MSSQSMPLRKGSSGPRAFPQAIAITWSASNSGNAATWDLSDALPLLKDGEHYIQLIGTDAASFASQLSGRITVLNNEIVYPNALSGTNGVSELAALTSITTTTLVTTWGVAADIAETAAQLLVFT